MKSKALRIFTLYVNHREADKVIRAGNGYCGVYPFNPNEPLDTEFRENDTMHMCQCVFLAMLIFDFFDDVLGFNDDEKLRILNFLMVHDLGESKYGDICDDGRDIGFNKVEEEERVFRSCVGGHPHETRLNVEFGLFEKYGDGKSRTMLFAKLVDKLEAVFSAFYYEKTGRAGNMNHKISEFHTTTEQDKIGIQATGSEMQADVWGYHFFGKLKSIKSEDPDMYKMFTYLIWAAGKLTRDKKNPVPWLPVSD